MRAIAADASVDAALIHHYFDSKQQLFLATVHIPVPVGDIAQHVAEEGIDGLGERLIRTILGIWDSDLQPSLIAAIRTSMTDPSMIRSISEFLTLEVIGRILQTLDLPEGEADRRAGLMASQVLGVVVGRYVSSCRRWWRRVRSRWSPPSDRPCSAIFKASCPRRWRLGEGGGRHARWFLRIHGDSGPRPGP